MTQKYFLIKCLHEVNEIVHLPLKQTQRIKFNCFDTSINYLIFGATSGGIYIYKRSPCQFFKLVPSKEGSVTHIAISPDEKFVALASSRGLIVLVENCFNDSNIRYQLYTEHRSFIITALKWSYHEIYCGDNFGKVSVISLTNLLSKAMFQTPSAILMHLDSSIVQLDVYSKFLLVSTKTKTYLCDTEEEQYRQIGKKLRDGQFGACFFPNVPNEHTQIRERQKSIFKILKEGEAFSNHPGIEGVKIYCSRPGLRIWEANFEASVVKTYQFKNTLNDACMEMLNLDDLSLKTIKCGDVNSDHYNFGKMILLANKFLITFQNNFFLVFNTECLSLLFQCNHFKNIKDVKVVNNYIYIWTNNEIRIVSLMDLETLIISTLAKKQYALTAQICLKYNEFILNSLENSDKLYLLSILKDKLKDESILRELMPLINKIKDLDTKKFNQNGIVTVANGHLTEAACSQLFLSKNEATNSENCNTETIPNELQEIVPTSDKNYNLNILYRQYKLNKLYNNIETPKLYEIFDSKTLDEIVDLLNEFLMYLNDLRIDDNNAELWCFEQYLKYVLKNKDFINNLDMESREFSYLFTAFYALNSNHSKTCVCSYPFPNTRNDNVDFYELGCILCTKISHAPNLLKAFCERVPYMWKFRIILTKTDLSHTLPLLIQFSDLQTFDNFLHKFTYDIWEDAIRLLIKIKSKKCLNCEKLLDFNKSDTINWKDLGYLIIKSIGGASTIKLFTRYSKFIPNCELGLEFYQSCIFATVVNHEKSINFMRNIVDKNNSIQFDKCLQKYLTNANTGITNNTKEFNELACSNCDLPLNTPILDEHIKLDCDHFYHSICLKNNVCKICTPQY